MLIVVATQTATAGMSREESEAYETAAERIEAGWADADQRGRAQLLLDHLAASKNSQRIVSQGWVVLDGIPVTLVHVLDTRSGNLFFRIQDEITGAWAACTAQPRDESDHEQTRERIRELLASEDEEAAAVVSGSRRWPAAVGTTPNGRGDGHGRDRCRRERS